jgi:hypothetical protein
MKNFENLSSFLTSNKRPIFLSTQALLFGEQVFVWLLLCPMLFSMKTRIRFCYPYLKWSLNKSGTFLHEKKIVLLQGVVICFFVENN